MGCGCKNKGVQPPQQPQTQTTPSGAQPAPQPNNTIQESIRKVVEKYYKK